ncbi:hypothetical protein PHYPSEUDO_010101 [Phytophthora pseudosyringae]|uniref:Transmembrane protein n=1 Tax=Phytophthora pseudosyringae TaxID=221518 RepID=A0A8T1VBL4_9STRA|nr:hypothetical protein PHYPSEUDO_010101 [Phytophthora pseudosyringae]
MARIQVASTVWGTESDRALVILSRWALHYTNRRNRQSTRMLKSNPEALIEKMHSRQLVAREKALERRLPFSWARFFVGIVSLLLVFTDIFRGGLGVDNLETYYPALHPDEVLGFGTSWNYSVFAATKEEAYSGDVKVNVWTYKFDSTSITWRAFAKYLEVSDYPACIFYKAQCPNTTFDGDVAFQMIDAVVDGVASMNKTRKGLAASKRGPVGLTLRTENEYIDRLHQFLLPKLFTNFNWRTNTALYYSPELLESINARGICFPANGGHVRSPHFCHELWTNLDRSCASLDTKCRAAGLLYVHTMARLRDVQTRFANMTVDLTFLESQEDLQVCRGALSLTGFRRSDVSTIIRARDCGSSVCETVFVEDYRYETGLLTSDVTQWYRLVAALRLIGQIYFWLRGISLMLSCYFVHGTLDSQEKVSIWVRLQKARNLFMKVPTQCVVYGSSFPVTCYVLAHLLDAPFTYNVLEGHFFSQAGVLDIKPEAFVTYAVVQMRSVWIYALAWQVVVVLATSSRELHTTKWNNGVTGVPEFLLSAFSSVTLIAQYRSTSFRSSKILRIMELPSNLPRAWAAAKYQYNFVHRGQGSVLLGGVVIDFKFLICLLFLVAALWSVHVIWSQFWAHRYNEGNHSNTPWFVQPPTPVPYSAGTLWPIVSVCVQWPSNYYCIREPAMLQVLHQKNYRHRYPMRSRLLNWKPNGDARVIAAATTACSKYLPDEDLRLRARLSGQGFDTYRFIQHRLKCLHRRSTDVEANVAFMNAILMSDPLVYLSLTLGRDRSTQLAYYQSIWHPQHIVLLPVVVVDELNEFTSGLKLIRCVNAYELTWAELVQCG